MRKYLAALVVVLCAAGGVVALVIPGGTSQSATGSVHPSGWGQTPPGLNLRALPPVTGVPTATMHDSIVVATIPPHPFAQAGYTAGHWPTYLAMRRAWPMAHTISIAIQTQYHAACLDDEPGDATPAQAGPWVLADIHAGFLKPCVYGDLSEMPAIQASLRASLGSNWRSHVLLWLAWYRFVPGLVQGYDAVQYTDKCLGRNLDCSTVTLDFLRAAQPPYVAPKPPKPPVVLPVCYTHRLSVSQCAQVKAKVASQQRAAASSARALAATNRVLIRNACRTPYRRGICVHKGHDAHVFTQRVRFFTAAAAKLIKAN